MSFFSKRMMRFIVILSVLTLVLGCLAGCGSKEASADEVPEETPSTKRELTQTTQPEEGDVPEETSTAEQQPTETIQPEEDDGTNFVYIKTGRFFAIICNTKTRVMYSMSYTSYNYGNLTKLVYQNNDPVIYNGDISLLRPVP